MSESPLFDAVYEELRAIARRRLRDERRGHTLQATALVNEVWLRLNGGRIAAPGERAQFFAAAADAMRHVLIDHARRRGAAKRGGAPGAPGGVRRAGGAGLLSIEGVLDLASEEKIADAVALDELISRLEQEDAQAARVVRLRFYAGLSVDETAEALGIGPRSVDRDWAYARAWLQKAWQAEAE